MGIMVYSILWVMQDYVHQPNEGLLVHESRRSLSPLGPGPAWPAALRAVPAKVQGLGLV